jgi:signal transduction histidine kinase
MKLKNQLAIFNAITRLSIILVLWLMLPILVENVVYKHIDRDLKEKESKFISHLDKEEIKDFMTKDSLDSYASFSTLHDEFVLLTRIDKKPISSKPIFINVSRIIEAEKNDYRILQYDFVYEKMYYQLEIGSGLGEIKELTFNIRLFILMVLIIIVLVTFILDTFYIEYLLKPFYKIIDTKIRRVNEPESFDKTPIVSHSKDFKELDAVLNEMMNRISALFKKEKQFIANVSHELLTPIALLKNKFENLIQNHSLDDQAVDKIASALRTLDVLKKVINNLLLISRIENNQYEIKESIVFNEIISHLEMDLEDRMSDKKVTFSNQLKHIYEFNGNHTLIHILCYNLIVNAIKYNRENGSIVVSDGFLDDSYYISISDTGIGMNENQLESIFQRFKRINLEQEGQGLGLAIVESIAQFHHIEIQVISEINVGTTFTLRFSTL